ncbi:MAG: histidine phosphatase family protein [Chloroflexota bacterium]|nr:histidine phosphatase family protein [Chloroflexota bacterium]
MSLLILVKHALPAIDPATPAPDWQLGDEGRRRSALLADRLAPYAPDVIAASPEPKASETAHIIAARHRLPVQIVDDLREHERRSTPFLGTAAFTARVEHALRHPDELVIGEETATAARLRFTAAVAELLTATRPEETLVVVAHGTVISLYVASVTGSDPIPLWQRLGLPAYVVLARPERSVIEVIDAIA